MERMLDVGGERERERMLVIHLSTFRLIGDVSDAEQPLLCLRRNTQRGGPGAVGLRHMQASRVPGQRALS